MGERLTSKRRSGFDRNMLRLWGLIIAAVGILSRGILQNRVLGLGTRSGAELLELLSSSGDAMNAATASLVMQVIEGSAVPIFVFLTVDGFEHTKSVKGYLTRVALAAIVSEIPYNLALSGQLWNPDSRNPMFGLVLVLVMLYLLRYLFDRGGSANLLLSAVVVFAAWIWAAMFRVENGRSMVVIAAMLWLLRGRHTMALFAASAAALCCCVGDPLFMFAPIGFLLVHFYNGEEGRTSRVLAYALYPVMLALVSAVGILLF